MQNYDDENIFMYFWGCARSGGQESAANNKNS